jgi:pyruvate kinase
MCIEARALVREAGGRAASSPRSSAPRRSTNIEEIIIASDAVMVARGDLGVEIGDAELPGVQKRIIHTARERTASASPRPR